MARLSNGLFLQLILLQWVLLRSFAWAPLPSIHRRFRYDDHIQQKKPALPCGRTSLKLRFLPLYKETSFDSYLASSSSPPLSISTSSSSLENTDEPLVSPFLIGQEQEDNDRILSYLPECGSNLPPTLRRLVARATRQHHRASFLNADSRRLVIEMADMIDLEYKTRHVPIRIVNNTTETHFELCNGDAEQLAVEIASVCALYELPISITRVFLKGLIPLYPDSTMIQTFVREFTAWNHTVQFPKGLAVQPVERSWRHRWTNRNAAQALIDKASQQVPPPTVNRTAIWLQPRSNNSTTTALLPPNRPYPPAPLYFPGSRRRQLVEKTRAYFQKLYATVKLQGRAGFLGYCTFNFLLYSIGMVVQWNKISIGDIATSSAKALIVRKYAKIFGILYGVSQLLKIPKLLFSIGVAPYMRKLLRYLTERCGWSEYTGTILLVGIMVVVFGVTTGVPILHEYHSVRQTIHATVVPLLDTLQPV